MKFLLLLSTMAFLAGCATTPLNFEARMAQTPAEAVAYGAPDVLAVDFAQLARLEDALDDFSEHAISLKSALSFREAKYFTQDEINQIQRVLFEFTALEAQLGEKYVFYEATRFEDSADQARGILLQMRAGLNYYYLQARLAVLFHKQGDISSKLNSAYACVAVESDTLREAFLFSTDPDNLEQLQLAWMLLGEMVKESSAVLMELLESDAGYADLMRKMATTYTDTSIHADYLVQSSLDMTSALYNQMRHTALARTSRELQQMTEEGAYAFQGFAFKNVARMHWPAAKSEPFSEAQLDQVIAALQPGDVVLTYASGYMSNVFLPGKFKHGITFVGSPDDRIGAGLNDANIQRYALTPEQAKQLSIVTTNAITLEGLASADCIEAVAEGVKFSSLRELMKTHIHRMVVLRPKITATERTVQLIELFKTLGVAYDYNFDFSNAENLCCTELIYRTLSGKGDIDLAFHKEQGKWVLTADEILRYALLQPDSFDVVLFADRSAKKSVPALSTGPEADAALRALMIE